MRLLILATLGLLSFPTSTPTLVYQPILAQENTPDLSTTLRLTEPMQSCVTCSNILYCYFVMGAPAHTAAYSPTGTYKGAHSYCEYHVEPYPCGGHLFCYGLTEVQSAKLEELALQLADGKDVIQELLGRFPDNVEIVPGRGIAVKRCGQIIAFRETEVPLRTAGAASE